MIYKIGMDSSMKRTLQENELWSKACPEPKHDNGFVAVVVVVLLTEAGYDEVNDVRNWKYDRYFLTLGNILRILLSLRKNDENDSIFSSFHHIDVTAMHLR